MAGNLEEEEPLNVSNGAPVFIPQTKYVNIETYRDGNIQISV